MKSIVWRRLDGELLDYCTYQFTDKTAISGVAVGSIDGQAGKASYEVLCGEDGATTRVAVQVHTTVAAPKSLILRRTDDRWFVNDEEVPELADCLDVDIGITPATNTLPIRRLQLPVGASQEFSAAWVKFPELRVLPLRQRYVRTSERTYLYQSVTSGFQAELEVDEHGVVIRYGDEWVPLEAIIAQH